MKLHNRLMTVATLVALTGWSTAAVAQEAGGGNQVNGVAAAPTVTGDAYACSGSTGCVSGHCHHGHGGARGMFNDGNCYPCPTTPCPNAAPSTDCIGAVGPFGQRYLGPVRYGALVVQDKYSPQPCYAYGPRGLDATRMNHWNRHMAGQTSWHGGYNYWRYGQPTALVVPPTAAFQTEYNWGVAQTRSMPIYAQFGSGRGGVGQAAPAGTFSNTPYWPSSTNQFGIYPVRSPW